jgi:hypothetical protein
MQWLVTASSVKASAAVKWERRATQMQKPGAIIMRS